MAEFQLRATITEIIDTTDVSDPREIAKRVAATVPARLLRTALAEALIENVRIVLTQYRKDTRIVRPGAFSAKRTAIALAAPVWRRALRERYRGADRFKMLGEFTSEDIAFAVEERRRQAQLCNDKADQLVILGDLVKEHDVNHVANLPEAVLAMVFEDVAA